MRSENSQPAGRAVDLRLHHSNRHSQSGEDGIIAKIFEVLGPRHRVCVEIGGYDLEKFSNTFELWAEAGWRGVLIEGERRIYRELLDDFARLQQRRAGSLALSIVHQYVTTAGESCLDAVLQREGLPVDFDFLSIDVDGVDYYMWESVVVHRPRVVAVEFNPTIPPHLRLRGSPLGNAVGCGLLDLLELGQRKGYDLVAITGVNAFFVCREEAAAFEPRNDIARLTLQSAHLNYAISTYDGGVLFTRKPVYGFSLWSREPRRIEARERLWRPTLAYRCAFELRVLALRALKRAPALYSALKHLRRAYWLRTSRVS